MNNLILRTTCGFGNQLFYIFNALSIGFDNNLELVIDLIKLDKITWEINIWAFIYIQYPELFDWYYGDHNILMFSNF